MFLLDTVAVRTPSRQTSERQPVTRYFMELEDDVLFLPYLNSCKLVDRNHPTSTLTSSAQVRLFVLYQYHDTTYGSGTGGIVNSGERRLHQRDVR